MPGLKCKRSLEKVLDRKRRFLRGWMRDGILAELPVRLDVESDWLAFEKKWGSYGQGDTRPFPSNEEIFERTVIGLA